ncbi:MAG: alanine racemase [Pseudomonadota bacterium]
MTAPKLTVDLSAIAANWRALDAQTACETAATIKADAYGLSVAQVAPVLAEAGARLFFVALAEEGVRLREVLGPGPVICVFSGHMPGDAHRIKAAELVPMINSVDQLLLHVEALPRHAFGVQLDTGMNRLGMEPEEWAALRDIALGQSPAMVMSHMACADTPDHPMNAQQLETFVELTQGIDALRSLAATGGLLLGRDYHFDVTRPGIGLYGGLPFAAARPVVTLDVPVIQVRDVAVGEAVGYGNAFVADQPTRVATIAAGYADGLIRAMGGQAMLYHGNTALPVVGRVSMDLITVDVTALAETPDHLRLLGAHQTVDDLAESAGTIGYEILTSLGARYARSYTA